jgi:phosphoglucosamine mutase
LSVQVAEKRPLESLPSMQSAIRDVESELGDRGRVLIRYSGTEHLARVMVEGDDEAKVTAFAEHLASELKRALASA